MLVFEKKPQVCTCAANPERIVSIRCEHVEDHGNRSEDRAVDSSMILTERPQGPSPLEASLVDQLDEIYGIIESLFAASDIDIEGKKVESTTLVQPTGVKLERRGSACDKWKLDAFEFDLESIEESEL